MVRRGSSWAIILMVVIACYHRPLQSVADERAPQQLRVMTYNIHHGEGTDGRIDMVRLAEVIRAADPDFVALQEVDVGVERSQRLNIPEELGRRTGLHSAFERNIDYQGGEYGNAILSRFEILEVANKHYTMLRRNEQRGLLHAVVSVNGRKVVFASTHLDFRPDDEERLNNADEIESLRKKFDDAVFILCGDFNDYPDSNLHRKLTVSYADAWETVGKGDGFTYSSTEPKSRIDYVFTSPPGAAVAQEAIVVDSDASDHRPLVVTLEIAKRDAR